MTKANSNGLTGDLNNQDIIGKQMSDMKDLEMMNDNLKLEVKNLRDNNKSLK